MLKPSKLMFENLVVLCHERGGMEFVHKVSALKTKFDNALHQYADGCGEDDFKVVQIFGALVAAATCKLIEDCAE